MEPNMKAIVFRSAGAPLEVLELRDTVEPTPAAGEVLVAVAARPIHPADLAFIRGAYRIRPALPQVAGLSGVGRVVRSGHGVGLAEGTRVAFRWPGAWGERVAVPEERVYVVPDDLSDDDGAQLPLNPITAWGLLDMAGVRPGQWVGLTAPKSSVAQITAALATMRGAHPLPIESSNVEGLSERVRAVTHGKGLSALLDCVGGRLIEALFDVLEPGATIVAYGTLSNESIAVRNATLVYANLTWRGFGIDRWMAGIDAAGRARMLRDLHQAIRSKRLPLPVQARFPLAEFATAVRLAQQGGPGKVFLE
jgi:NADPH:quinone reductase-like Zn-dependent oxidoreductase